jgi:cell division transport system permease protein
LSATKRKVDILRISTIGYSAKQGIKNIWRNIMFSAASIATMTACIFLFGLFFSLLINFRYIVKNAEEGVAVTVLFDDGVDQATINSIGEQIKAYKGVTKVEYVSAEEAWDEWSKQYFGDTELESEMAEGFKNDNPLANSSSYSVYVDKIEHQDALVKYIEGLDGVREVNQLKGATQTLSSFNTLLTYISVAIILILLCVAVFLISNTVAIGISIRKEEIGIMKLIGATNFFVRAPFLIEGMIIGLIGAIIPLVLLFVMYKKVIEYVLTKFSMLSSVVQFMSVTQVFEVLTPVALILGMGIGLFGSVITIRKHLRV